MGSPAMGGDDTLDISGGRGSVSHLVLMNHGWPKINE